ncbi:LytR C-terminal domain-containing protein [Arthrobacter sp. MYb213]|uniref:LytR C-terminal domain-containing protein n=1 Tax=Arthrobacter sp. MYb213 TaxID=1848595 RepID=UPI000CFC1DCB|nr:LytR C-terminal domain-containing protein [Arthrobacter sp. MYb213]PRB68567.1 hypothetical protein CQ011_12530 [Arthrobacter sp. MYb213]
MTNYPRDEFDRVPEFSTRVGSHHAHGWAQSAAAKGKDSKLRWVVLSAIAVLLIGGVGFFYGPSVADRLSGSESTQNTEATGNETSQSPSAEPTESATPSSTIDDADVLYGQLIGVYNGANIAGTAGAGEELLTEADFTNIVTDNWTRDAETSTVYYMSEAYRTTAEKAAEVLGIDQVLQTQNIPNRVTVVLGADDTLNSK